MAVTDVNVQGINTCPGKRLDLGTQVQTVQLQERYGKAAHRMISCCAIPRLRFGVVMLRSTLASGVEPLLERRSGIAV